MKNTNYSVKKYQTYGILLLALLFCGSVEATVNHYVGGYAQLGEWSLMPKSSKYGSSLGVAGGLGFTYELQTGKRYQPLQFVFNTGVGATYGWTAFSKSTDTRQPMEKPQIDMENEEFTYFYYIRDRKDQYTNLAVHFPLMIGVQYHRIYALIGVKFYANMWTQTQTTAKLTTYGEYWNTDHTKKIYDDIKDIPEYQFFTNEPLKKTRKTNFKLDADLSVEIGARLGVINYASGYDVPKRTLEYRIGAFLDYGLFDVHTSGKVEPLKLPDKYDVYAAHKTRTMIDNLELNDVMRTKGFAKKVQNLMVGIKFTILFQMPEQQKCVMCADSYKSIANPSRDSGGMQYEE
jgi:hypothetical protein